MGRPGLRRGAGTRAARLRPAGRDGVPGPGSPVRARRPGGDVVGRLGCCGGCCRRRRDHDGALVSGDLGLGAGRRGHVERGRHLGGQWHGPHGRFERAHGRGDHSLTLDLNGPAVTDISGTTDARTDSAAVTDRDLEVLAEQLGRLPRGVVGIAARCVCGRPLVVRTAPRLDDGTPFPTTYYLTCPPAVAAVSTLEAGGLMKELTARLADDAELAAAYRRAHEAYLADREELGHVEEIAGVSAGGMPTRVKCLHVPVGHALAAGPGVNPIGDLVLTELHPVWAPTRCTC